jgi:hypothetical protein
LGRDIFTKEEGTKRMGKGFATFVNEEAATPWHGSHENNSIFGVKV